MHGCRTRYPKGDVCRSSSSKEMGDGLYSPRMAKNGLDRTRSADPWTKRPGKAVRTFAQVSHSGSHSSHVSHICEMPLISVRSIRLSFLVDIDFSQGAFGFTGMHCVMSATPRALALTDNCSLKPRLFFGSSSLQPWLWLCTVLRHTAMRSGSWLWLRKRQTCASISITSSTRHILAPRPQLNIHRSQNHERLSRTARHSHYSQERHGRPTRNAPAAIQP
jgi:hypothetical protein